MVAYVSYQQKIHEKTVWSILLSQMNIDDIKELPTKLYEEAIAFLVDLKVARVMN